MILYHGTDLKSAKNIVDKNYIDVFIGKKNCDFGPGFYMSNEKDNAAKWALKKAAFRKRDPAVVTLEFDINNALPYIEMFSYDMRWARFVINNRTGEDYIRDVPFKENNLDRRYAITCGKIADEEVSKISKDLFSSKTPLLSMDQIRSKNDVLQYAIHIKFATEFVKIIGYTKY